MRSPKITAQFAIVSAAVAATATVATMVPGDLLASATAHPVYEDSLGRLELENSRLRADLRSYRAASDELMDGLDRIETASARLKDRRSQQTIKSVVTDVRERVSEFVTDTHADDYGGYGGGYGGYYGEYGYTATDADVAALTEFMTSKNFAEDQLAAVKTASDRTWFTTSQIVALMDAATNEDTKIEIAALLHSSVTDPHNWYLIENGLTFSSSKQTLRSRLGE
jgi:hypothetical protein